MRVRRHRKLREDIEEPDYDAAPLKTTCRHCGIEVVTYVEHELSPAFYGLSFFLVLVFGWFSIVLIPLLYLLMKDAIHRCSRCLLELGTKRCFGFPDVTKEILVFRMGSMSVVIARIYAAILLGLLCVAFGYYLYTAPPMATHTHTTQASVEIGATWEEYIQDCGAELVVQNSVHAKDNYKQK